MRWNIGGHAHGNARAAVEQHMGQPRGQYYRLLHGAIEVGRPLHGALAQFTQQHVGKFGELGLGVAHRREGFGVVWATPVTLAIHQRVAVAERLRHQHHGFIAGAVSVGVELTQYVTDGTRRLLVLGIGMQRQLAHGVDDPPLHGFHAIANVG